MPESESQPSIDPIHEKWSRSIQRIPFKAGDKVVVAVSGGCDSVCLLHMLKRYSLKIALSLHIAHLNHGFRAEAQAEADFVESLSRLWGIPLSSSRRSVKRACRHEGLSKQEGARVVRYRYLREVARDIGASWIALGHTADDQAETFLMHILRGSGMRGLKGMPEIRDATGRKAEKIRIIRPLLKINREEILNELKKEQVFHMEDPSNLHPIYLRNQIRHSLFPVLENYNPKVKKAFCQAADLLGEEDDFIEKRLGEIVDGMVKANETSVVIDLKEFNTLHLALKRRVLRWGIDRLHPGLRGISFQHIETIIDRVVPGPSGHYFSLPSSMGVVKEYACLRLERKVHHGENGQKRLPLNRFFRGSSMHNLRKESVLPEAPLSGRRASTELKDWDLRVHVSLHQGALKSFSPCIASFDFDKIFFPLFIRGRKPGDRFTPMGMKGHHKKLQDFFVDIKCNRSERDQRPLLVCAEGILWVIGLRTDERYLPTDQTKKTLMVEVEQVLRA